MRDLTVLDQLITGRVDPHIYAFTTNTIPNYLKVGDTYRPVAVRLQEWREHFPDLQKEYDQIAKVSDDVYFRDFAVHSFLEGERHRTRLLPANIEQGSYYSREFFKRQRLTLLRPLRIFNRISMKTLANTSFTAQKPVCRKLIHMNAQRPILRVPTKTKPYDSSRQL